MRRRILRSDDVEQHYCYGEAHPKSRVPDEVVHRLRDLHENPPRLGAYRLHAMFPNIPVSTIENIIHYRTRLLPKPPQNGEQN